MKINDMIDYNKPRERLKLYGVKDLTDFELLAIVLNTGTKKKSALELSFDILNKFNLRDLYLLSYDELIKINGIKESKACTILASIELVRRMIEYSYKPTNLLDPMSVYNYVYPKIIHKSFENCIIFYLDSKCNIIKEQIIEGQNYYINIDLNDIVRKALITNSRGIILVHNHPTGDPTPSNNDIKITEKLNILLEQFNIILFDHIIIGFKKYYIFSLKSIKNV